MTHYMPDSRYAWQRLAASLALATIAGIGLWAPVVALPTVQQEFNVDRAGASIPYTLTMVGFGLGGLMMGRLVDRFGIVVPMIFGTCCIALGFVAAAFAPGYVWFIMAQAGLIGMLGVSPSFGPLVADVSLWFRARRGLAVAIVASGNYLAGALWSPLLNQAIATYGWRNAFITVGLVSLVTMLPLIHFLRPRLTLENTNQNATFSSAKPGTPVLQGLLVLAGLACCVAMSMPQVHIIAYCGDLGYGSAAGARMLSLMLGFGVLSRLVSGVVADKIGGLGTLLIGSTMQALALAFYVPFNGLTSLYLVSALFGLAQGGIVPSYALIVRDNFPASQAGTRISLVLTATVLGMALGGWLSGEIYDATGSYAWAFLHGIGWNLLNLSIAVWLLFRNHSNHQPRMAV
jgi:MFS family permease